MAATASADPRDTMPYSSPPPVSVFTTLHDARSRAKARRVASMKRLDERLTPAAAAAASSQPIDHHAPYLLLQLETRMLEAIVLQLDTVDEANAFRQTCRTIRAITTADGFARLWHAAHPDDVKAKAVLQRMKRHFHEEVDREELETVDADASRQHHWPRVLAARRPRAAAAAAKPSALERASAAWSLRFAEIDAHELEVQCSTPS